VRPEGLGKLIKIINILGSRTRDLPACSTEFYHNTSDRISSYIVFQNYCLGDNFEMSLNISRKI
jgi:hypothetical protein